HLALQIEAHEATARSHAAERILRERAAPGSHFEDALAGCEPPALHDPLGRPPPRVEHWRPPGPEGRRAPQRPEALGDCEDDQPEEHVEEDLAHRRACLMGACATRIARENE